jgi:predicted ABC-type ATPase
MSKRMRVFAGPNGSGKSSIIKSVLNTKLRQGRKLDFGVYVNADDIAVLLNGKGCKISTFEVSATKMDILEVANKSGLINSDFSLNRLDECLQVSGELIQVNKTAADMKSDLPYERIAQILSDYFRKKLLETGKKFSFETVFSHESKVDIIKRAQAEGYKVYLYFVSTEHPEINVYRVKKVRVPNNGHDVEEGKIRSRYYRSMNLMFEAAQYCYQAYFFDNSVDGSNHTMFAHFKVDPEGNKIWDDLDKSLYPVWFKKYYSAKLT